MVTLSLPPSPAVMLLRLHLSLSQAPLVPPIPDPSPPNLIGHRLSPHLSANHVLLRTTGSSPLPPLSPALLDSPGSSSDAGLRFREKLLFIEHDLGLDSSRALYFNPSLRSAPLSAIRSAVDALLSFGLLRSDASRVFAMYPSLLTCEPSADLVPVYHFLLGPVEIPFPDIRKAVARCPRLLVSSVPDRLLPALNFLRRLGFVGRHRITCRTTVLLVSSVEDTFIPKLEYLRGLGFSHRETRIMVLRSPGLLTFSIENNFKPKLEFLRREMGRDLSELKDFPQYFSFNLERKIKPRHRLLTESRAWMPLSEMLKVSDGDFLARLLEMKLTSIDDKL